MRAAIIAGVAAFSLLTGTAYAGEKDEHPTAPPAVTASAATTAATSTPAASPTPAATPAPAEQAPHAEAPVESKTPLAARPTKPLTLAPEPASTPWGYKVLAGFGVAAAAALWIRNKRRMTTKTTKRSRIDVLARQSVGVRSELLVVEVDGTRLFLGMTPNSIQTLSALTADEAVDAVGEETESEDDLMDESPKLSAPASLVAAITGQKDRVSMTSGATARAQAEKAKARASATKQLAQRLAARDDDDDDDEHHEPAAALGERVRSLLAARREAAATKKPAVTAPTPVSSNPPEKKSRRVATPKTSRIAGQAKGLLLAVDEAPAQAEPQQKSLRIGEW